MVVIFYLKVIQLLALEEIWDGQHDSQSSTFIYLFIY